MRGRLITSLLSAVAAAALAIGVDASGPARSGLASLTQGVGSTASRVLPVGRVVVPSLRRLLRRSPSPTLQQSGGGATAAPTVQTDSYEYAPGSIVYITGSNWQPGELITLSFVESSTDPSAVIDTHPDLYATADADGNISNNQFSPDYKDVKVLFTLTAKGPQSGSAQTIFEDANPSANLDQCANDPSPSPSSNGCATSATQWVNGNLGGSKSFYLEGDSIPYRLRLDNLATGTAILHTVTIQWDTTKAGKHAIDYLTTFNQSVLDANPCLGVSGCSTFSTFAIPADPQVTGAGVTPIAGVFRLYGGTITAAPAYTYSPSGFTGDTSASITISFTASVANPVLAWGGHIATRKDWGTANSAIAISGSPYHTRLLDLDGSGGNQDRSLSADAVFFPADLKVVKVTKNAVGTVINTSDTFTFTATGNNVTGFTLNTSVPGTTDTQDFPSLNDATARTITESTPPSTYNFVSAACVGTSDPQLGGSPGTTSTSGATVTVTPVEGSTWVCTYVNQLKPAHLTIIKHVINDNGGTAVAADFTMNANPSFGSASGSGVESPGTQYTLASGVTYNVTETGPTGYTASSSGDCSGTIVAGVDKTCTVTNNDNAPQLHLVKTVTNDNGGTALATAWTLTATGANGSPTNLSGFTPVDSGATFKADTYALAESGGPANYTAGAWNCGAATMPDATHVVVPFGGNVTCTINNNDNAPQLHLRKTVTNDNGGTALATDWTLTATGALASPTNLSGSTPVDSGATFKADTYALGESGPANYTGGAWNCGTATMTDATHVVVPFGGNVTCTINNNDNGPQLHLRKTITNDSGGTAAATDWTLTATGASGSPTNLSGSTPVDSGTTLKADTYALAESGGPANYTAGAWNCGTATMPDATHVVVPLGGNVTCTINNNDNPPQLHLRKTVTNDNGGTALATAWTLTATGASGSPTNLSGSTPVDSGTTFKADTYALGESGGPANYTAGAWNCGGATMPDTTHVVVPFGGNVTCTINNNDNAPQLHLRKTVTNDNGGTAVATDWTLTATGASGSPTNLSGSTPVDSSATFKADTYALAESGPANYTAGAWNCGTATMPDTTHVVVPFGGNVTCTINNNDNAPGLHLRKIVVNDSGGTALATAWTLTANGGAAGTLSGSTPVDSGTTLMAGTYALSESGPTGYSASAWVCVGGTQNGSNITVGVGQSATCTITNDDIPAQLTVNKICAPTTDTGLFNLQIDSTTRKTDAACGGTTGVVYVNAGTHSVGETQGTGTPLSDYVTSIGGACTSGGSITLGLGQSATCTITNTRKGAAKVVKTFQGLPPTGSQAFTFQLRTGASPSAAGTTLETGTANAADGGIINFATKLVPGTTYQLCEQMQPGWLTTLGPPLYSVYNPSGDNSIVCTDFTVAAGQTKEFDINNQPPPGGMALTIGYWKNWTSCTGGGQKPVTDQTLQMFQPTGFTLGSLTLYDTNSNPNVASDCSQIVNLLNKSTMDSGKKMASDPIFNMVAQLVAAQLNVKAGAGLSLNGMNAISQANALLTAVGFTGNGYLGKLTSAQAALANCLATALDQYNNNKLVQSCQ